MRITIASFNIKSAELSSVQAIAQTLINHRVDIVGLQEVDQHTVRSKLHDQSRMIADLAHLPYVHFSPTLARGLGQYGIATLSRYPMLSASSLLLPVIQGEERRRAQVSRFEINGTHLDFVNTHLSFVKSSGRPQMQYLVERMLSHCQSCVVAGDFNGQPVPEGFQRESVDPTWPSHKPSKVLDHIAVSQRLAGNHRWQTFAYPNLTDHCLLTLDLEIPGPPAE